MYEIRATEEAKTVEKACPTLAVMCYNVILRQHVHILQLIIIHTHMFEVSMLLLKNVFVHKIYLF